MWSREIDELGMLNQTQKGVQCSRIFKIVLIIIMAFILAGGIAILSIGVWTHEVEYGSKAVSGLIGFALYQIDSVIMIICGTLTIVFMILGIIGVWMPQKCVLGFHLSVMTFVSFGLFAAGILGYVFVGELEDSVRGSLKESVTEKYGLSGKQSITKQWDNIQRSFECCGAYGTDNSTTSWALYRTESFWFKDGPANGSYVPESCCTADSDIKLCTGRVNNSATDFWPPYHLPPVTKIPSNYTLYMTGCYDKLEGYLHQNGILIGTAAVVVAVFMIAEIVMTIFIYRGLH